MSVVVEHVYHLANGPQKRSMLVEMYSTELQLFKDLTTTKSGRYFHYNYSLYYLLFLSFSLVHCTSAVSFVLMSSSV
jgi:hypothetical protein